MSRRALTVLLVAALLCAGVFGAVALHRGGSSEPEAAGRPNIVMILDDDESVDQQHFLSKTNAAIGGHGVTFDNSFVNFSLCCPSRATLLTGQYAHNHGVRGNEPPSGGYSKLEPTLGNTLPVWLQKAGYYTGHIGKYLNHYGEADPTQEPPGWNQLFGTLDNPQLSPHGYYAAYGYTLNQNGRIVHYGSTPSVTDPPVYQTDVFSRLAANFIRSAPSDQPFYLSVAPRDPHVEPPSCDCEGNNPRAAPRHEGTLRGVKAPRTPDFNEADVADKPSDTRKLPVLSPHQLDLIDRQYRAQAEALLGVDDLVQNVVETLKQRGELDNTVIIFSSDNGDLHGQHRVLEGKVQMYEPSIRVPLLIRGPGVPQGVHRRQLVGNVDLAPTILDFAHAQPGRTQDGQSLRPVMRNPRYWPGRGLDLEAYENPATPEQVNNPPVIYRGVRTDRYAYARYAPGEQELYDLRKDPFELQNAAGNPAYARVESSLQSLLGGLADCAGASCRSAPALSLTAGGCASAAVTGPGAVQEATFYLDGKMIGRVRKPPIRIRLPHASTGEELEALATSLDGRIVSLQQKLRC